MVVVLGGDSGNVDVCGGIAYGERFIEGWSVGGSGLCGKHSLYRDVV